MPNIVPVKIEKKKSSFPSIIINKPSPPCNFFLLFSSPFVIDAAPRKLLPGAEAPSRRHARAPRLLVVEQLHHRHLSLGDVSTAASQHGHGNGNGDNDNDDDINDSDPPLPSVLVC